MANHGFSGPGTSIARIVLYVEFDAPSQQVLYIGLLECGMTITVVNLPSVWHLCTKQIPSEVRRNVRSLRSLRSEDPKRCQAAAVMEERSSWAPRGDSSLLTETEAGPTQNAGRKDRVKDVSCFTEHAIRVNSAIEQRSE